MTLNQMLSILLNDKKFHTKRMLGSVIYFSFILRLTILVCEVIFDFTLITVEYILPFFLVSFLLVVAFRYGFNANVLAFLNILLFYLSFETQFLTNPKIFHFINYWFVFIVIIAMASHGIKQSFFWLGVILLTIILNAGFVSNRIGSTYTIEIPLLHTAIAGIIFTSGIFLFICLCHWLLTHAYLSTKQKSAELKNLRDELEQKGNKLERYQKAHFQMSGDISVINGELEKLYQKICKLTFENMRVSRVSIWTFAANSTRLERKYLYHHEGGTAAYEKIDMQEYPAYFRAIATKKFIAAEHALDHPDTIDLVENYFTPLQIYSLLDCPFMVDGKLIGVISCENQYVHRQWTPSDILFIQSLSDFISLSHKSHESQVLLQQIQSQNEALREQRHEIEAMNEQLSLMNETLEQKVLERTQELEQQNKVLTEYAFINSHQLRAPLSRILGLSYLIRNRLYDKADADLIKALIKSTNELDIVVNRISKLLYDGNHLSRDDIREMIERNLKKEQL